MNKPIYGKYTTVKISPGKPTEEQTDVLYGGEVTLSYRKVTEHVTVNSVNDVLGAVQEAVAQARQGMIDHLNFEVVTDQGSNELKRLSVSYRIK